MAGGPSSTTTFIVKLQSVPPHAEDIPARSWRGAAGSAATPCSQVHIPFHCCLGPPEQLRCLTASIPAALAHGLFITAITRVMFAFY